MNKDQEREIRQLWFIANYYFKLAREEMKKIPNHVQEKIFGEFANIHKDKSEFEKINKSPIISSAHLNSGAVRLGTIDEIIWKISNRGKKYIHKSRKELYSELINEESEEDMTNDFKVKIHKIFHYMLRDNIAHKEPPIEPRNKERRYAERKKIILEYNLPKAFEEIESVKQEIEKDIHKLEKIFSLEII